MDNTIVQAIIPCSRMSTRKKAEQYDEDGLHGTGLRLPQAAFRDLVPVRSYHASTGVVTGTRAACGKSMLVAVIL